MAYRPIKTEVYIETTKAHLRLRILPREDNQVEIVEARRRREGEESWRRARNHEGIWSLDYLELSEETLQDLSKLRKRMFEDAQ